MRNRFFLRRLAGWLVVPFLISSGAFAQTGTWDVNDIKGRPSVRTHTRVVFKKQLIYVENRKKTEEAYREGLVAGQQSALQALAGALPAPEQVRLADAAARKEGLIPVVPAPTTTYVHRQNVVVRFQTPGAQPVAGIRVTPVVQRQGGEEEALPSITTDVEGRVELEALDQVPLKVEFRLEDQPQSPGEWRYRDPRQACLNLDSYRGQASKVALRGPGIQLASAGLSPIGHLPPLLVTAPNVRTVTKGPGASVIKRPAATGKSTTVQVLKKQAQAGAIAERAREKLVAVRRFLKDNDIKSAAPELREPSAALLNEALALCERALVLYPGLVRAHQYAAEAEWFLARTETAITRLEKAGIRFPRQPELIAQLQNYKKVAADRAARKPELLMPSMPAKPETMVIEHSFEAPAVTLERTVVDLALLMPEGQEEARVFMAPAVAGEGGFPRQEVQGTREGRRLKFRLPADLFAAGGFPMYLEHVTPGGVLAAVLRDYPRPNPYQEVNELPTPPLRLERLTGLQLPVGVDVLQRVDAVYQAQPELMAAARRRQAELERNGKRAGKDDGKNSTKKRQTKSETKGETKSQAAEDLEEVIEPSATGSRLVPFPKQGLALRTRRLPHGFDMTREEAKKQKLGIRIVEAVRLTGPQAGSLGGLQVGDPAAQVARLLGPPESSEQQTLIYLDGGLRIETEQERVSAIELLRPIALLTEGTHAFVAREPAQLFIREFRPRRGSAIADPDALERYLERTGVVRIVRDEAKADLVLSARAGELKETRDKLIGTVPLRYECETSLVFTVTAPGAERPLIDQRVITQKKKADWWGQFAGVAGGAAVIATLAGGDAGKIVAILLGATGVAKMRESMTRVVARTPALLEQALYGQLADELYGAADYSARVTRINYDTGEVFLNIGTATGVRAGLGVEATHLELFIGRKPLPAEEDGLEAD